MSSEELFGPIFVLEPMREAVSARAWVAAMLDAERALAVASARAGVIEQAEADAISAACEPSRYDVAQLADEGRATGNPVEPLVRALRERSGVERVHWGATSQDILDTAAMLVARRARGIVVTELDAVARASADLADAHRTTVMAGRTLLQQAVPTTFGLKAAGWLASVVDARRALLGVELQAQLGGAAGTLALLENRGPEVLGLYAEELGLEEPVLPWHAFRGRVAALAGALGVAAGAAAKIGLDVALLAQTEVAEVNLAGPGRSSTMPHKRNPVSAVLARACALRVHALVATLTLAHEHERAAGAWHAEWEPLAEALSLTGAAAAWAREALETLEVDADRMRSNLADTTLSEAQRLPDPPRAAEDYLGSAETFVDRALALYRSELA